MKDVFSNRTRHIALRYHFVKELLRDGELTLEWERGSTNAADMLTKALPGPALSSARDRWGMRQTPEEKSRTSPHQGGV